MKKNAKRRSTEARGRGLPLHARKNASLLVQYVMSSRPAILSKMRSTFLGGHFSSPRSISQLCPHIVKSKSDFSGFACMNLSSKRITLGDVNEQVAMYVSGSVGK